MDLSIRDWMLVIGVLLILAVLLDGYRRVRKDRIRKVRMSLKPVPGGDEEPPTRGELPNGGARVAPRNQRSAEPTFGDDWQTDFRTTLGNALQDSAQQDVDAELPDVDAVKSYFTPVHSPAPAPEVTKPTAAKPAAGKQAAQAEVAHQLDPLFDEIPDPVPAPAVRIEPAKEPVFEAEPMTAATEPAPLSAGLREIIIVNAVSKDPAGFNGEELLHILLTCDLRFGKMNIFHRYEKSNAKGAVQFSVANAVEPGTFDLNNMRTFQTPGICLFLQLPGPQDAQKALEYMVETAQCIARNLNGELRDENRNALTAQTVEHYRSRIREFDRKRMAKHA